MATPTNTGVRFEVEVWCDVKTGQINVVGAEPRVRQLITSVKRGRRWRSRCGRPVGLAVAGRRSATQWVYRRSCQAGRTSRPAWRRSGGSWGSGPDAEND
jgi:hypothetical protein